MIYFEDSVIILSCAEVRLVIVPLAQNFLQLLWLKFGEDINNVHQESYY